jgi:hypothetical protein
MIDKDIIILENKIFNLLNGSNGVSVHFKYENEILTLLTYNSKSDEFFLLKEVSEEVMVIAYEKMYDYVKTLINSIDNKHSDNPIGGSYTVEWSKNGGETFKSYFYCNSMEEVLTKFYFGKEGYKQIFEVYDIKLNPLS